MHEMRDWSFSEREQKLHLSLQPISSWFLWLRRRSMIYFQELVVNGSQWAELWVCDRGYTVEMQMYHRRGYSKEKIRACAAVLETRLASYLQLRMLVNLRGRINPWYGEHKHQHSSIPAGESRYFPLKSKQLQTLQSIQIRAVKKNMQPTQGPRKNSTYYFHVFVCLGRHNSPLLLPW